MDKVSRPLKKLILKQNCRGQAAVEALFAVGVLMGLMSLALSLIYMLYLKNQIHHLSHEAMICREFQPPARCDFHFKNLIRKIIVFGQVEELQLYQKKSQQKFYLKVRFLNSQLTRGWLWKFENQIQRPLVLESKTKRAL